MTIPVIVSWSGGKDSAMALFGLQRSGAYDVRGLLTTLNEETGEVPLHGVGRDLIRAQADALGLPLIEVALPPAATNAQYEGAVRSALAGQAKNGVTAIAYGDLFLADIRTFREKLVAPTGLEPIFPLWGRDTRQVAADFISTGFHALVVSVELARLDAAFAGRALDHAFLADLPAGVDPCGENGEYHSFVTNGPDFERAVGTDVETRYEAVGCFYHRLRLQ